MLKTKWTMVGAWRLLLLLSVFYLHSCAAESQIIVPMPSVNLLTVKANDYKCTSVTGPEQDSYIVQYEPLADPRAVHHMLLFGCRTRPPQGSWNCKSTALLCGNFDTPEIIFAWALNASGIHMPPDVGMKVGPEAGINYFVVQIHYGHVERIPDPSTISREALSIQISQRSPRYIAGIYLLGSGETVRQGSDDARVDSACRFRGPKPIHPFAFRTHAHSRGKQIVGYVLKQTGSWQLIGTRSPQDPQAFYPVGGKDIVVSPGDWLAVRCIFNTASTQHDVHMGPDTEDEMCNFYIMYYTMNDARTMVDDDCWSRAPRFLHYPPLPLLPRDGATPLEGEEEEGEELHEHHGHVHVKPSLPPTVSDTPPSETPPTTLASVATSSSPPPIIRPFTLHPSPTTTPPPPPTTMPPPPTTATPPSSPPSQPTTQPAIEVGVSPPHGTLVLAEDWALNGFNIPATSLGQLSAVAVDPQGNLHVLHRGPVVWDISSFDNNFKYRHIDNGPIKIPVLLKFSAGTGKPDRAWGGEIFYMPHGLTVGHDGSFWVTDVALHQVFKFDSMGDKEPSLTLGTRFVSGSSMNTFCQPASVAVERSGVFYVADGYCNHRIMKYTREGKLAQVWQAPIAGHHLFIPHKAILNAAEDILYVADRQNSRIISYTTEGGRGSVFSQGVELGGGFPYSIAFNSSTKNWPMHGVFGGVAMDGGKLMGFTLDSSGTNIATWGPEKGFENPHDIVVDTVHSAVYVTEIGPNRLWKFVPFPRPPPDISEDLEEVLGGNQHSTTQGVPPDLPDSSHKLTSPVNTTEEEEEEEWEKNLDSSSSSSSNSSINVEEEAGAQDNAHRHKEEKPMVGVNVGVTVAVLAVVALIALVTVGVLKEHRFIKFQGWRLLQAGERDTTIGVKAMDGTTTMREADKKKRKKKKRRMSPRRKLQSLLGPSHLGFSRLRTYDSNSEDEEFPVFNRV